MMKPIKYRFLFCLITGSVLISCKKEDSASLPVVITHSPLYVSSTRATIGLSVESNGGADIVCGLYIGLLQNPETSGAQFQMGSDTGTFFGQIIGLDPNTQYYIKAYAKNTKGESLGDLIDFTTQGTITDYDNNVYETVKIGNQLWMAKNLKATHFINGDLIGTTNPSGLDISNEVTPKYQWSYSGNEANTLIYGRLYTWYAITDSRNICPAGWHIPTDNEWTTLENTLGGYAIAGRKLKEDGNTHWLSPYNLDATNESCFTALPGGYRDMSGVFYLFQNNAYFWSSSESDGVSSWARTLDTGGPVVSRTGLNKSFGASVRCIKDN